MSNQVDMCWLCCKTMNFLFSDSHGDGGAQFHMNWYTWMKQDSTWQKQDDEEEMSCHCPNRLSLSMGLQGVAAGANPSLVSGRRQGTPWISWGRNVIGQCATLCAALSSDGLHLHKPLIGPYNTERFFSFLDDLYIQLVPAGEMGRRARNTILVVVWDTVAFHHSAAVTAWFTVHPRMSLLFLPPYLPFLNHTEEFYFTMEVEGLWSLPTTSSPCWMQWMLVSPEACQGWIRHSRRFYPRCLAKEDIRCDVEENVAECRWQGLNITVYMCCFLVLSLM